MSPSSFPQIVSSCLLHARSCFGYSGTTVQIQIRFFLSVGSCLAGGAGQDLCGWRQRGWRQLLDVPAHGSRGSVLRPVVPLRAPLGPRHGPARLGARPQPNPHVGSSTSAWLPTDVSLAVPFKAPPGPQHCLGAAAAEAGSNAARRGRPPARRAFAVRSALARTAPEGAGERGVPGLLAPLCHRRGPCSWGYRRCFPEAGSGDLGGGRPHACTRNPPYFAFALNGPRGLWFGWETEEMAAAKLGSKAQGRRWGAGAGQRDDRSEGWGTSPGSKSANRAEFEVRLPETAEPKKS